jgi:hypothetical protein
LAQSPLPDQPTDHRENHAFRQNLNDGVSDAAADRFPTGELIAQFFAMDVKRQESQSVHCCSAFGRGYKHTGKL